MKTLKALIVGHIVGLFLASFQALKLASAHLVHLSVLAGITPFASTDNSSSPTNFPKRLLVWVELRELSEVACSGGAGSSAN